MTGTDGLAVTPGALTEPPARYGGTGYLAGSPKDYDRAHALDVAQLFAFLRATQPEAFKKLGMADAHDAKDINRLKFLTRLSAELGKRGVIDVLRKGIDHHPAGHFDLFYGTPSGQRQGCGAACEEPLSASRASWPTAWTRRAARWTWACSSTACPSPPSS
jgi:type I restriction enzyme R subunit